MRDELSEETVSFSIANLIPVKVKDRDTCEGTRTDESEFGSPSFDNEFLEEIDQIVNQADLASSRYPDTFLYPPGAHHECQLPNSNPSVTTDHYVANLH